VSAGPPPKVVTITLSQPITVDGDEVGELTFKLRRMTLGDARFLQKHGAGDETRSVETTIAAIALIADIPFEAAEKIDADDIDPIQKAISPFLDGPSRPTRKK